MYGGRQFNFYKHTKKAIENNFLIFKCKSYRHLESKLKGKERYCYSTIRLYDNHNPEKMQYFMEINHSNWCDTNYLFERNEHLKKVLTPVPNGFENDIREINNHKEKIIDKEEFKIKLFYYFNDKYPQILTEV